VADSAVGKVEDCSAAGDEDCDGIACSDAVWSFLAGDAERQAPRALAVDSRGEIFVVGAFQGAMTLLNKTSNTNIQLQAVGQFSNIFLAKFGANGEVIWAKSFASNALDTSAEAVAVDAQDGVVITGSFGATLNLGGATLTSTAGGPGGGGDAFVARFDADGAPMWSQRFGTPGASNLCVADAIAIRQDKVVIGGYMTAGATMTFGATTLPTAAGYDGFVATLDAATGEANWAKPIAGGAGDQLVGAVGLDAAGNAYVGGDFSGSLDIASGATPVGGAGDTDVFVAKLDTQGNTLWTKELGSSSPILDTLRALTVDASGNVILAGSVGGAVDFGGGQVSLGTKAHAFVARLAPDGKYLAAKAFNATKHNDANGVAVDTAGNVYVTGYFNGTQDLGNGMMGNGLGTLDIFLAKLDPSLKTLWSKSLGDAQAQVPHGISFDKATDRLLLAAEVQGGIDFGTGLLNGASAATADFGLAKFQP
jgi:hypothetical protein